MIGQAHRNRSLSTQRLCREVIIWKRLSHPNVLPLLGVSVSKSPQHFRIISEWMPNGNVTEYTKSNPEVNRLRLASPAIRSPGNSTLIHLHNPQLYEVASGVTFLHELGIAHGDLKGVSPYVLHDLVVPLTVIVGQCPHRPRGDRSSWRFRSNGPD